MLASAAKSAMWVRAPAMWWIACEFGFKTVVSLNVARLQNP